MPHCDQKHSFLTDDNDENKKTERYKKCVIKQKLKFENYKHCLEGTQLENKINQLEKIHLILKVLEKMIQNS